MRLWLRKLRHINRVTIDKQAKAIGEECLLSDLDERIRAQAESLQGWIYFSTDIGKTSASSLHRHQTDTGDGECIQYLSF